MASVSASILVSSDICCSPYISLINYFCVIAVVIYNQMLNNASSLTAQGKIND
jgi:hypothetical protein